MAAYKKARNLLQQVPGLGSRTALAAIPPLNVWTYTVTKRWASGNGRFAAALGDQGRPNSAR